jgi:hypothetical protein
MSKKLTVFFVGFVFLFSFRIVRAAPVINEIMYDLDGSDIDWIEIYNPDSADVDVTTLKLLISNSTSNHGIVQSSGSHILHQGEYGVIVPTSQASAFSLKWTNSINLFTSAFTLPNHTGKVEINNGDKNVPVDSVTYGSTEGASGDGKSLQLVGGSWISSHPTPGAANQEPPSGDIPNSTDTDTTENATESRSTDKTTDTSEETTTHVSNNSGSGSSSAPKKVLPTQKARIQITTKQIVYIGIPFYIEGAAFGVHGEQLFSGKYFWNFGDGSSREVKIINTDRFFHTYFYPGEYTISLEHFADNFSETPDVAGEFTVKVISANISISRVGNARDFFVELTNNTDYPADLSGWFLTSDTKSFTIPHNTILASKKTILISGWITNFSTSDKDTLKLLNPGREVVFDYSTSPAVPPSRTLSYQNISSGKISVASAGSGNKISAENVEARAFAFDQSSGKASPLPVIPIISALFIGAGASSVYFIRKNKGNMKAGDDFEILDE